jgi:predicted SnoaL-like aldol condensation-catalyzing enzyme
MEIRSKHPVGSIDYNKAFIINHFEEFVNKKNSAIAYTNLSDDFLDHDEAGGPVVGPEPAKKMMDALYKFMPDIQVSIVEVIAESDKVMVRNIWSGTNHQGIKIQFKGFVLWKLKDGKITERWATVTPAYPMQSEVPEW